MVANENKKCPIVRERKNTEKENYSIMMDKDGFSYSKLTAM